MGFYVRVHIIKSNMKILVIAPLHDYPTILSNKAVSQLLIFMNSAGVNYDVLRYGLANRALINLSAKLNEYTGVFYYGHGDEDRLGDWFLPIMGLIDEKNIGLFKDTIFYTMACLSGVELAETSIKKGVKSYFGHMIKYFAFVERHELKRDFLQDWIDLVIFIPKQLILGDSTGIALMKYDRFANQLYSHYLSIDKDLNLDLLYKNALHLELFGNRTATLNLK